MPDFHPLAPHGARCPELAGAPPDRLFLILLPGAALLTFFGLFLGLVACPIAEMALTLGLTHGEAGVYLL